MRGWMVHANTTRDRSLGGVQTSSAVGDFGGFEEGWLLMVERKRLCWGGPAFFGATICLCRWFRGGEARVSYGRRGRVGIR